MRLRESGTTKLTKFTKLEITRHALRILKARAKLGRAFLVGVPGFSLVLLVSLVVTLLFRPRSRA